MLRNIQSPSNIGALGRLVPLASLCALVIAFAGPAVASPAPTAAIESGRLSGVATDGVLAFKGVPYAKPPVGALRWRPPQPAAHWSGVRAADAYGHDCMQKPFPSDAAPLGAEPAEDCLVLNVWRPAQASTAKLPVMVWIHGGGFVNGGSSPAVYSGEAFAKRGVVFVSLNYRLGRFGFFGFPALTAEHPNEPKGNYGYMDQIAALKWVKRNIAAFGGDPANVTVFGESAGGGSVHMLLTSPLARGLFSKAIIESGGGRGPLMGPRMLSRDVGGQRSAEAVGVNFARAHGIEGSDAAALAKLRALSAEDVTDGLNMATSRNALETYAGPMQDGRIVVETPDVTYLAGRQVRVPLIIGANSADIGFPTVRTKEALFEAFGPRREAAIAAYDPTGAAPFYTVAAAISADRMMVEPARFTAAAFAAQGLPAYEYRFSYVADSMRRQWATGAPHASEIPYVFDTVAAKYGAALTSKDAEVASMMNRYWVNFARTGDPNGPGLPQWPRYAPATDQVLDFRPDGAPMAGPDLWRARLDLVAEADGKAKAAQ